MRMATAVDVARMRDQLFFEGPEEKRRLSRFWLLLTLAAVIAAAGVVGDSVATVIGAMIVAPLMVPILGTVLAVVLADRDNLLRCTALVVLGAAAVVAIGYLLGLTVSTPVVAEVNGQVASRVSPRIIDLIAALATGAVGSIALARDDISDTLPGVAIAISLVPPLSVVGLTLESGETDQALGALLLFTTNVSAILAMGLLVMTAYRVRVVAGQGDTGTRPVHRRRAAIAIVSGLAIVSVPLAATSAKIAGSQRAERQVTEVADAWADRHGWAIATVEDGPSGILVRATGPLPEPETASLRTNLDGLDLGGSSVAIELIPSRTVDLTDD